MKRRPPPPPPNPVAGSAQSVNEKPAKTQRTWPRTDHLEPHQWKPGESGNPNGRPRSSTEMKQKAAAHTDTALDLVTLSAQAARTLIQRAHDVILDKNATIEKLQWAEGVIKGQTGLKAAQAILDRGHGKPQQKVDVDFNTFFDEMTPDQLDKFILDTGVDVTAAMKARRAKK